MNVQIKEIYAVLSTFEIAGISSVKPFGSGHINNTFLVKTISTQSYILQSINPDIFTNVPMLMDNMMRVTDHIQSKIDTDKDDHFQTLSIIKTIDGQAFVKDARGIYWRLMTFIPNTKTYDKVSTVKQAFESGKAFGHFQHCLDDLPGEPLFETIPDFHNIHIRLEAFNKAIYENKSGRLKEASEEIKFIQSLQDQMTLLIPINELPLRVTHNDTKINNVLFNQTDNAMCVIDLDTVMPGLIHYDFSDGVRTAANAGDEDESDLNKVYLDLKLFEAFSRGFIQQVGSKLAPLEKETLAASAKFLPYCLAMRFLTDYLNGDVYFKVAYSEHNLVRFRAQLKLFKSMVEQECEMKEVVEKLCRP